VDSCLLINLNNTWAKFCPVRRGRLGRVTRIATRDLTPALLRRTARAYPGLPVMVASVVPAARKLLDNAWPSSQIHDLGWRDLPGLRIRYPHPERIGADRLANALAVVHLHRCPAIVVDLGTALTFDIISSDREYLGGVIAPGLRAFTDYLHERTALLPRVKLRRPRRAIGKSTEEAICIGAYHGYRGLVHEVLQQVRREFPGRRPTIIATGGDALLLAGRLPGVTVTDPLLTLRGLKIVAEHRLGRNDA
jgi:type III pantothenate kinase